MKILVTGTAGFIGFHVARKLLMDGHHVFGIDNFNSYYPVALKEARHGLLENHVNYVGQRLDLADNKGVLDFVDQVKPEVICHLAAQAGVRYSLQHPFEYQKSNLQGFLSVLEACRQGGVRRLVYASSSSVYGNNKVLPFRETDQVDHPISLYAATKKANELMAHTYSHLYKIQTIGLRFFTVYGPWGRPDMAMWSFTESLLEGKSIPVFNNGQMWRDFTYIDDIVAGVEGAMFKGGLEQYEIFNLGNHKSELLLDMISELGKALGVEPKMDFKPMQPGDVESTYADVERAGSKLGFSPSTAMQTGIREFARWYLANPELAAAVREGRVG